jgi:hypothetical protein
MKNVSIVLVEHTAIILSVERITDDRLDLLEIVSTGQTMWRTGLILLRTREAVSICTRGEEQGLLMAPVRNS